jgi:hypothetical protein
MGIAREDAKYSAVKQRKSVRFEVFTTVTAKNEVFWDVTPWGACYSPTAEQHTRSNYTE